MTNLTGSLHFEMMCYEIIQVTCNYSVVTYLHLSPTESCQCQERVECVDIPGPIFTGAYPAALTLGKN